MRSTENIFSHPESVGTGENNFSLNLKKMCKFVFNHCISLFGQFCVSFLVQISIAFMAFTENLILGSEKKESQGASGGGGRD